MHTVQRVSAAPYSLKAMSLEQLPLQEQWAEVHFKDGVEVWGLQLPGSSLRDNQRKRPDLRLFSVFEMNF